jgi:hypothetical protein
MSAFSIFTAIRTSTKKEKDKNWVGPLGICMHDYVLMPLVWSFYVSMCIGYVKIWFIEKTKNPPVTIFIALTGSVTAPTAWYTKKTVWTMHLVWKFEFER